MVTDLRARNISLLSNLDKLHPSLPALFIRNGGSFNKQAEGSLWSDIFKTVVNGGFSWERSKEGFVFWSEVHRSLYNHTPVPMVVIAYLNVHPMGENVEIARYG